MTMATDSILAAIDAEIARLTQARKLLAGVAQSNATVRKAAAASSQAKRTRVLSPEARKRIAEAQRRRWAAQKAKAKKKA